MIEQFSSKLSETYSDLWEFIPGLIIALGVVLFFILLGKLVFVLFRKILDKRWKDSLLAGFIANVIKWAVYLIGFSAGLDIVGYGSILSGILAGAGIGAIIIGFAFKDIGENFLAGILLAFNRPFSTGDIIEVEGHKGTVRDLTLRAVHIRNAEGKDFYIPTSSILKNTLINYTRDGMLRLDFFIGISPEDDIETVRI
ncbi:MAG: mechanosensitive ion channel, partial [Flavobacteriales bacterium]|nr:mechanosensitive ion channel [Flavobacteriales bacterium]